MDLLILFFVLSVSVSFVCSILEAVLLSITLSYISVLEKSKPKEGKLLRKQKENISESIGSILILNTIANTLGAAAVGAQASKIYGDDAVVIVSVILTFAILFFSEIIPKTIGAIYWKVLAPHASWFIKIFVWITYPVLILTLFVTNKISRGSDNVNSLSKEELLASTLQSEGEGAIDEKESDYIENVLKLDSMRVEDILTPRLVVFALDENMSIKEVIETQKEDIFNFSRIPVYGDSIDDVRGIVLTKKIFEQALKDDSVTISHIKKDIFEINKNVPVSKALDLFITKKEHMFLVVDGYDQTEGILTLEDCVETLLGIEIVDESDRADDMRLLAKQQMKQRRRDKDIKG